jgi:hypothetical protein
MMKELRVEMEDINVHFFNEGPLPLYRREPVPIFRERWRVRPLFFI